MVNIKKYNNASAVQLKRLITATAILAMFFLILVVYGQTQTLAQEAALYGSLDTADEQTVENLPPNFESEVCNLQDFGAYDVNVNDTKNIVGFVCTGSAGDVVRQVQQQMQNRGWVFLSSGVDTILSAKKSGGRFAYAYIQLFEVEGQTSVVFTVS